MFLRLSLMFVLLAQLCAPISVFAAKKPYLDPSCANDLTASSEVRETQIWGKWDCVDCGTKGISAEPPAGEKLPKCPNCGSPREDDRGEKPYLDNAREASGKVIGANVADTAEELQIAQGGKDWFCSYCSAGNRAGTPACAHCGASREEKKATSKWDEPAPVATPAKTERSAPVREKPAGLSSFKKAAIGAAAVAVIGAGVKGVMWATTTHPVQSQVSAMPWTHSESVERFTEITESDWRSSIQEQRSVDPINGMGEVPGVEDVRNCQSKHRRDESYQCGVRDVTERVPERVRTGKSCHEVCSVSDNKNGSFKQSCRDVCEPTYETRYHNETHQEPKYCTRPIYEKYCDYTTHVWKTIQNASTGGNLVAPLAAERVAVEGGQALPWPNLSVGRLDRRVRAEDYRVEFSYTDEGKAQTHVIRLNSEAAFREWSAGKTLQLNINNLGMVQSTGPEKE